MDINELKNEINNIINSYKDINDNPDLHDGCYEFLREIINIYKKEKSNKTNWDVNDLDLLYYATTFESRDVKLQRINNSNLSDTSKKIIIDKLNYIQNKFKRNEYNNNIDDNKPSFGIFRRVFGGWSSDQDKLIEKRDEYNSFAQYFLILCTEILNETKPSKIYSLFDNEFIKSSTMEIGIISQILHVLKPNIFPILNDGAFDFYKKYLKIKRTGNKNKELEIDKKLKHYIDIVESIERFKQNNGLIVKNYRVLDIFAQKFFDFENIRIYISNLAGTKPDERTKKDNEICSYAYSNFKIFANKCNIYKNTYTRNNNKNLIVYPKNWQKGSKADDQLWIELKNEHYKSLPCSISLFANKNNDDMDLKVTLELKTDDAEQDIINLFMRWNPCNIQGINKINEPYRMYEKVLNKPYIYEKSLDVIYEAQRAIEALYDKYIECCKIIEQGDDNMTQPLNQILYGPPGTGKTYETQNILKKFKLEKKVGQSTKEISGDMSWWQAIALTMYNTEKDKKYSVPELIQLMSNYIEQKNNNHVSNKLWEQLQKHTDYTSKTVFNKDRFEPFLFDKTKNNKNESLWHLTENGINYIEDQLTKEPSIENTKIDDEHIKFITFHQSYSYEEFVEGIKPITKDGRIEYHIVNGIFKEMCIRANANKDEKFLIIIDEINRGNISKIFGELITLIEEDKRIKPNNLNDFDDQDMCIDNSSYDKNSIVVTLPYSQKQFGVPKNLYIIGTMNTADRSIASVDIALRRRFRFVEMMPDKTKVAKFGIEFDKIFEKLNQRISLLLDRDHQIGHSYFIEDKYKNATWKDLQEIWFDSILPLLNEYCYGDWEKLQNLLGSAKETKVEDEKFSSFIRYIKKDDIDLQGDKSCGDEKLYEFVESDKIDFIGALRNGFPKEFTKETEESSKE